MDVGWWKTRGREAGGRGEVEDTEEGGRWTWGGGVQTEKNK